LDSLDGKATAQNPQAPCPVLIASDEVSNVRKIRQSRLSAYLNAGNLKTVGKSVNGFSTGKALSHPRNCWNSKAG